MHWLRPSRRNQGRVTRQILFRPDLPVRNPPDTRFRIENPQSLRFDLTRSPERPSRRKLRDVHDSPSHDVCQAEDVGREQGFREEVFMMIRRVSPTWTSMRNASNCDTRQSVRL